MNYFLINSIVLIALPIKYYLIVSSVTNTLIFYMSLNSIRKHNCLENSTIKKVRLIATKHY